MGSTLTRPDSTQPDHQIPLGSWPLPLITRSLDSFVSDNPLKPTLLKHNFFYIPSKSKPQKKKAKIFFTPEEYLANYQITASFFFLSLPPPNELKLGIIIFHHNHCTKKAFARSFLYHPSHLLITIINTNISSINLI